MATAKITSFQTFEGKKYIDYTISGVDSKTGLNFDSELVWNQYTLCDDGRVLFGDCEVGHLVRSAFFRAIRDTAQKDLNDAGNQEKFESRKLMVRELIKKAAERRGVDVSDILPCKGCKTVEEKYHFDEAVQWHILEYRLPGGCVAEVGTEGASGAGGKTIAYDQANECWIEEE